MATLSDGAFWFLSLCAQRPGSAPVAERLQSALLAVPSFDALATAAEQHGMEPLVLAHIERTGLANPAEVRVRLQVRRTQHAHAAAVRTRVVADGRHWRRWILNGSRWQKTDRPTAPDSTQ
jgi:hypothetical protein